MNTLQLPAHLQGARRQVSADAVAGMGMAPVPYLTIEGTKFTLIDAAGNEFNPNTYGPIQTTTDQNGQTVGVQGSPVGLYIDVTVVDVNPVTSKAYYVQGYQPNAAKFLPPDCWSDNGVAPSTGAMRPQNDTCELCPLNEWGSKVNNLGNEVKACDDIKKLALVVPMLVAQGMKQVFLFRLKGSSHRNWRTYVEKLSRISIGDRQLDVTDVVTRIFFEPGKQGILGFQEVSLIDGAVAAAEDEIWQTRATDTLVGRLDKPRNPTGLAHAPVHQLAGPAAAPKPTFVPPPAQAQPQGGFGQMTAQPAAQPQPTFVQPQQPVGQQPAAQPAPADAPKRRGGGRRNAAAQQPAQPVQPAQPQQQAPQFGQQGFGQPQQPVQPVQVVQPVQPVQPAQPAQQQQPTFGFTQPAQAQPQASQPQGTGGAAPPNPPSNFGMAQPSTMPTGLADALNDALRPLPQ